MTQFVPPPMEKKRKDKDEEGGEDEVLLSIFSTVKTPLREWLIEFHSLALSV